MQIRFFEKRIIRKIQKGDAEAFAGVYDKYIDKVYKFVYYKVRTQEQAEDITSQVFTKVLEYILSGKEIGSIQGLIYASARNLITDFYRDLKEEIPVELVENEITVDFNNELEDKEGLAEIEAALRKLKGEAKEAMILRYIDDYSVKEVAKIMGKSEGSVRVMIHRAKRDLREKLRRAS